MMEGFDFGTPKIATQLTGDLAALKHYNGLSIPPEYFMEAMGRLRDRFLSVRLKAVLHPASASVKRAATKQKAAAQAAPAVEEKELTAQQWFERGVAATDVDEELRFYTNAIRLKPDSASAYYNRGLALYEKAMVKGAQRDFSQAIRLHPDDADAYVGRGLVKRAKGELEGALQDFTRAIRLKPDLALAYNNRAAIRYSKGDLEGALQDYDEAVRIEPGLAAIYYNRGLTRRAKGDVEDAQQDHDEAVRLGYKPKE